jgi:hypothetical protein
MDLSEADLGAPTVVDYLARVKLRFAIVAAF